jgi:hypothetical protein
MSMPTTLRRLPLPRTEPPYDDELPERVRGPIWTGMAGAVQGTLALAFHPADDGDPGPAAHPDTLAHVLHLQPERKHKADEADTREPVRTPRTDLPDPRPWARGFVQALTEVLDGFRPTGQLASWAIPRVTHEVTRRAGDARRRPPAARPVVRSVHVSEPRDGAAEVCAIVRYGERCRALALRLEGLDGRWQCTVLTMG